MNRPRLAAVIAAVLLATATARAQPVQPPEPATLRGESPPTRKRLAEADRKLDAGNAADAVEAVQRVLDEAGDDLITLDNRQFRPARAVAHQILAKLPADALRAYRERIDGPAAKLLEAGRKDRDPRPLRELLDRYFVSGPAEEASVLLGDLLFERGEFRAAGGVWRRLLPDGDPEIAYPLPTGDPAAVRARVVLAAIFQDEPGRARDELAVLKERHANAAGRLAGTDGPYVTTLQALLDRPPRLAAGFDPDRGWPGFGGGPDRDGRVPGRIPAYWPSRPTWAADLPSGGRHIGAGRPAFGHPVVLGGQVYVSDGHRVFGFNLKTGTLTAMLAPQDSPLTGNPSASLAAADGRLFARLGHDRYRDTGKTPHPADEAALVCFAPPLRELWRVRPPTPEGKSLGVWEGSPLVAGGRMWAVVARYDGGRLGHAVVGYDPADAPGRPAWVTDVSDAATRLAIRTEPRAKLDLLTLAGRNVVFCTHAGTVVALDAVTGRRAWAYKYPRSVRIPVDPSPSPVVFHGGRVFVAPADADRVFALDAETGRLLWEVDSTENAQLLGVARNRLIVTVAGPVRGIRGLNVANGLGRSPGGWVQHNAGVPLSHGRGLVTDDLIAWPTRDGLFFLRADDGRPITDPLRNAVRPGPTGQFGNLAYADGVLVVVTPSQVWGFVSDAKPFGVPDPPADPERRRFEVAVDDAERRLGEGDTAAARADLFRVMTGDHAPRLRAWAAARLLLLTPPGDAAKLVLPADLLREWVFAPDGGPVTLGTLVARHTGRELPGGAPVAGRAVSPDDAPRLDDTARIHRTVKLSSGSVPLRSITGSGKSRHLFVSSRAGLRVLPLELGPEAARVALDGVTHAADVADGFVAAGPFVVAVYGAAAEPVWVFRVPATDPLPERPGHTVVRFDTPPRGPELSAFVLAGGWLFARLGDRHLIALDLPGRRVGWVLSATGRPRYEPTAFPGEPRFGPHFYASASYLVVQLSDGRRWTVRAGTGRVHGDPRLDRPGTTTAAAAWVAPPGEIGKNRLATSDGPGTVRLVDPQTGRVKWEYDAGGEASLTGEPPQSRVWGDALFVAVRRNHGIDLDRLDPATGRSEWSGDPAFLDADRVHLADADADAHRLYVPTDGKLAALARGDGKVVWDADLPETHGAGGWTVRAGRGIVVAYPVGAIPAGPPGAVWDRLVRSFGRWPAAWRLPALAVTLYDAWAGRTVPVLLFDAECGMLLKQVDVPALGPTVAIWVTADAVVVATGDRVVWIK